MSNSAISANIQFTIDSETLDSLPPLYKEVANILIERGKWRLLHEDHQNSPSASTPRYRETEEV